MKFICGACKTKYTISDEKVRGKVLKVKCKKCEAVVEVREATTGDEAVARVVAPGASGSGQGHAPVGSDPRPRLATGPGLRMGTPGAVPAAPPAASGAPRQRTATGPVPAASGGRPRTGTAPPPPPPDALKPGGPGFVPRPGTAPSSPRTAGKPATGTGFPAARGPSETKSSGVRPAARPGGFLASGVHGGAGGLASSLAEAISASVVPPPPHTEAEPATVIAGPSFVDGLLSKTAPKEWWAAIRDTPTGPMTRDEIDDHIKVGDVDAESLVWREGQDDWRPLRDVHALSDLVRGTGRAPIPKAPPGRAPLRSPAKAAPLAPDRSIGSVATPISALRGAVAVPAPGNGAGIPGPRFSTARGMFPQGSALPASPGSGSLQIPIEDIGAYLPTAPAPGGMEDLPRLAMREDSIVPPPPARRMSPVAWIAVCGALAFGITLALGLLQYLGPQLGTRPTGPTERVRVVTVGGALPDLAPTGGRATGQTGDPAPGGEPGEVRQGPRPPGGAPGKTKALSAEDQALLERFQRQNGMPAGGSLDPTKLRGGNGPGGQGGGASALTADQVRAVVARERSSVQSCYERAMRGRTQAADVRVTVVATVGSSGVVTSVSVRGGSDPTMTQCIQGAVRRWRFPAAAGSSQPEIPFLFTAHSSR
jgi:predicted Zn finger-like uncharacterized protein